MSVERERERAREREGERGFNQHILQFIMIALTTKSTREAYESMSVAIIMKCRLQSPESGAQSVVYHTSLFLSFSRFLSLSLKA